MSIVFCKEKAIGRLKTTSTTARSSTENVTSPLCNHFSIIPSHYTCKMCSKYPGIKLVSALQRKEIKLQICRQVLTSSTQRQNSSFHVVERMRTDMKCTIEMNNARAKATKLLFVICQICKFMTFLLPSSSCLGYSEIASPIQNRNGLIV